MKEEIEAITKNAIGTIDLSVLLKKALEKEIAKAVEKELSAKLGLEITRVEISGIEIGEINGSQNR